MRRTSSWRSSLVAAGAALAVVVSGCGSGSPAASPSALADGATIEELVKAAEAEGSLTWYSTESQPINEAVVKAFETKYKIKVTVLRLAAGEMTSRYTTERQVGQATADLITWGGPEEIDAHPDWYLKLAKNSLPEFATYPEGRIGWSETNVLVSMTPIVIAYNTNLVKSPPEKWSDVTDPRWMGKIAVTNPSGGRTYLAWAYMTSQKYGDGYLRDVIKNEPVFQPSGGPGAQQVAAGAFALSVPNSAVLVQPLKARGAPIDMVIPDDPYIYSELRAGITSNAPHPNAAKLFVNYRVSAEGQQLVCDAAPGATASARSDLGESKCLKLPTGLDPVPYSSLNKTVEGQLLTALGLG
jgi:iron(III) transport system substrate-binding protein